MQLDYETKGGGEMTVKIPSSTIGILYGEYPNLRETARPVSVVVIISQRRKPADYWSPSIFFFRQHFSDH